jgi:hypothetical protein
MIAIITPIFVLFYKNMRRKGLLIALLMFFFFFSMIPVGIITLADKVNSFPGINSVIFSSLLMKPYFRLPAFLWGIYMAIVTFEHKYVGTTNDGT